MKSVERVLLGLALAMLGWCAWSLVESRVYQNLHRAEFETRTLQDGPRETSPPLPHRSVPEGTAVGRIEIPRIGVSAIIAEGATDATLRLAVGHIPGTAFPGESGNTGLAGHRDGFFRSLSRIRLLDEIRLTAEGGSTFLYRVDSIAVVEPGEVSVLAAGSSAAVTLVTCYPFHFLGAAPKRFVVKAGRVPS